MPRKKTRLNIQELEEHVVDWFVDRVYHEREIVNELLRDKSICDDELMHIFAGIADNLDVIRELIAPIEHDEKDLVEWIEEFLNKYYRPDYNDRIRN